MNSFHTNAIRFLGLALFFGLLPCAPLPGQQYPFLLVPGSPKNERLLFQQSSGRLWIGGESLVCFDGSRFLSLSNYGFPQTQVRNIAEDAGGGIWIIADAGIYRFFDGHLDLVTKTLALGLVPVSPDWAVAAVTTATALKPSNVRLVRIRRENSQWILETLIDVETSTDRSSAVFNLLSRDHSGNILYPVPGVGWNEIRLRDLDTWRPGSSVPITEHKVAGFPSVRWVRVFRDRFGCLWTSSPSGDTYDCGGGARRIEVRANVVSETADGAIVLRGTSSLAVGRPGSFQSAGPGNGLPFFFDALVANDGTVWLGSSDGLYRFPSPFRLEYWSAGEGLGSAAWSFTRSGNRSFAGLAGRIMSLVPDRSRWQSIAEFPERGDVMALLPADRGEIVAAFKKGGVAQLSPEGKILAQTRDHFPPSARRLLRTPDGTIWVGADRLGSLHREGNILEWQEHALQTQPSSLVLSLKYEAHSGRLWSCYKGGLVTRENSGEWREFTIRDGLAANPCWSLAPLPDGRVWDAYYGVNRLGLITPLASGGISVRTYGEDGRIGEAGADTFDVDGRGWLWRSLTEGVYVAAPASAENGNWLQLTRSDGFPDVNMNTGSFFADPDNSVWFGVNNYLVHYAPPPDFVAPQQSPQVFLSAFSLDGKAPQLAETAGKLPHGSVTAHVGSLQFQARSGLRLRYRVRPGISDWQETSTLDLPIGSLSTGAHTLEVQARHVTGPWSAPSTWRIDVAPPLWFSSRLLLLYAFMIASLAGAGYLLQSRRQQQRARLLPDLSAWRIGAVMTEARDLAGVLDARFEIGEFLARGGFAYVLQGYDRDQQQPCAIKIFRSEIRDTDWIRRRFAHEVAALTRVRHPNVVTIYAHGVTPSGAPYLIMEFIAGRSLREILENGALRPQRTARLLMQLGSALDAIHAQAIFHRDVKPENIIVRNEATPSEQAVLIDFSIAIVKETDEALHGLSRAAGTFDYMAPEQAIGHAQPSSDIYSLAKLAIELLTGSRLSKLLPNASIDLPERVADLVANLPSIRFSPASIALFAAALQFDPSRRPVSAGAFILPIVADLDARD